jgi:hypothetical protein
VACDFFGTLDPCFGGFDFLVVLSFEQGAYDCQYNASFGIEFGGKKKIVCLFCENSSLLTICMKYSLYRPTFANWEWISGK